MNTVSSLNKIILYTGKININDFNVTFDSAFTKPVILGVKFMTECNRQFKLESDGRNLTLFLIICLKEITTILAFELSSEETSMTLGKVSHLWKMFTCNDRQKPIISDALGNEESSSNFIFNTEFAIS